ncbi:Carboxy-terminal processing protease CtpA precursor [Gimesia alba]|uniref:Carboxy-terminal processing protease CtpA n=1 Tax=Gimesia alba TaxID=2527973 RepID=A0A517RER0_9PLAN|nr:S41 family peptidase [Gimesia alba]QDT42367.1 Carboxy-terminal processing protease CtpA precursor [Gimesia alba]
MAGPVTKSVLLRKRSCVSLGALLLALLLTTGVKPAVAEDLSKKYPASLDFSKQPRSYNTATEKEDVWSLSSFDFKLADRFEVKLGAAQVALGRHDKNVLWAAVFPDKPGEIVTASAGKGEQVTSVWLRFHPARLGELFPANTVVEQGNAALIKQANGLASHKMRSSWHKNGRPMVPLHESIIIDLETKEGSRRFYVIDTKQQTVKYVDAFRNRVLPVVVPFKPGAGADIFDKVWNAFDREYAMFVIKPDVKWQKLRDQYRPQAVAAKTNRELADVLSEMLTHLKDLHVYVLVDGKFVKGFNRERFFNASPAAAPHLIGQLNRVRGMRWGRTKDDIGYIAVDSLSNAALPDEFQTALKQMRGTHGLILDLRANGGGAEPLAMKMAGYFLDQPRLYAMHQYRSGPQHTDLGAKQKRNFSPNEEWYYRGPVVVLLGEKTMSSAEAFALMLAECPNVTTLGDRTAGSSGNPRRIDAGAGIIVNLPRWIPLDVNGKSFDTVGVQPDIKVQAAPKDFTKTEDPVLTAALKRLRKNSPNEPGRSEETLIPRK